MADTAAAPSAPESLQAPTTDSSVPQANGHVESTVQSVKDSVVSSKVSFRIRCATLKQTSNSFDAAQSTLTSIQNNPTIKDITNGPVAENVKVQAEKTSAEFQNLATRTVPEQPTATGQPLTHYHSRLYRLLSWENPRATSITFAVVVALIFAARFVNILRYAFKFAYFILGVTASLEIAGKLLFDDGLATKMRPTRYWTFSRDALERNLDDAEQLLNFFAIESQRVIYAENIYLTVGVFAAALVSYWLIKLVPFWGLSLIGTCVVFLGPLIYIKNQESIDGGIESVSNIVVSQAAQIKDITAEQTSKATASVKSYAGEYSQKAQELIGRRSSGPTAEANSGAFTSNDFPEAPKAEPLATAQREVETASQQEALLAG